MNEIPSVTVEQMREVDRMMVKDLGVSILMMMENASRNIAILARKMLGDSVKGKNIVILCGKGNNGGDGLGAARHLINFGSDVKTILATSPDQLSPDPKIQLNILNNINAKVFQFDPQRATNLLEELKSADLIIDALLGYNLKGDPQPPIDQLITLANESLTPILAIDLPSGLDGNSGVPHNPTIKASTTLTLALPKTGLLKDTGKNFIGELYLADLSVPNLIYQKIGIKVPVLFESEEIIKIAKF